MSAAEAVQDMVGGNLSILEPPSFSRPLAAIAPRENMLIRFRGNAPHR